MLLTFALAVPTLLQHLFFLILMMILAPDLVHLFYVGSSAFRGAQSVFKIGDVIAINSAYELEYRYAIGAGFITRSNHDSR